MTKYNIHSKLEKEIPHNYIIHLYKEGLFVVMYQYSALYYKKTHKEIKTMRIVLKNGDTYIKCGIPLSSSIIKTLTFLDGRAEIILPSDIKPVTEEMLSDFKADITIDYRNKKQGKHILDLENRICMILKRLICLRLHRWTFL